MALDHRIPNHHLWGADGLRSAGYEVTVLGSPRSRTLGILTRMTRSLLGDLARQARLLREAWQLDADVIICAETSFARGIGFIRRFGLLRTPVIGIQHPGSPKSFFARYCLLGFDRVICLSDKVAKDLEEPGLQGLFSVAHWGPDVQFDYSPREETGVIVSCGRSWRDHQLLTRVANTLQCEVVMHGQHDSEIADGKDGKRKSGFELALSDIARASVVAIPLTRVDGCFGITELNDALALGKPIVMTRTDYIDVDIEAEGCGFLIEKDDIEGWIRTAGKLLSDDDFRTECCRRSRLLAETNWNYQQFCEEIVQVVNSLRGTQKVNRRSDSQR